MRIDDEILSQANEFTMVSANDALTLTWYIVQAGEIDEATAAGILEHMVALAVAVLCEAKDLTDATRARLELIANEPVAAE